MKQQADHPSMEQRRTMDGRGGADCRSLLAEGGQVSPVGSSQPMGRVASPGVRKSAAAKTLLLAMVVMPLLTLFGVELGLRALLPTKSEPKSGPNPCTAPDWCNPPLEARQIDRSLPYGYHNRPNVERFIPLADHNGGGYVFRTNSLGLRRDDEVSIPKPPDVFRVLVLGDSQVEGYVDNDEHYPHRLEQLFREHRGDQRVEVLNAATGGYGPLEYYHWLRTQGVTLEPDLVIVTVYLGNDLLDFAFGETMESDDVPTAAADWRQQQAVRERWTGELLDLPRATGKWLPRAADESLHDHSLIYRVLHDAATNGPLTIPLTGLGVTGAGPDDAVGASVFPRLFGECHGCWPQYFAQAFAATPARLELAEIRMAMLLTRLDREVTAHGGRLAVVMLPTKAAVDASDVHQIVSHPPDVLRISGADLDNVDRSASDVIRSAASSADVSVIDVLPGLIEAARAGRLYYRRDWHLNADGHRALAETVYQALVSGALVNTHDESTSAMLATDESRGGKHAAAVSLNERRP